jgi:hypothetical protein
MENFEKSYIGKGKLNEKFPIIRVSIDFEESARHTYEKDGKLYLTFEIAPLRKEDKFGKTHTAYVKTYKKSIV